MKLRELIEGMPYLLETRGDMETEILEITSTSRDKTGQGLFFTAGEMPYDQCHAN